MIPSRTMRFVYKIDRELFIYDIHNFQLPDINFDTLMAGIYQRTIETDAGKACSSIKIYALMSMSSQYLREALQNKQT